MLSTSIIHNYAQNQAQCGIFTTSETRDAIRLAVYSFQNGSTELVDELYLIRDSWIRQSRLRSGKFKVAELLNDDLRFYQVNSNGIVSLPNSFSIDYISSAPRLNPWSYDGRFLALIETMVSRTSRLFVLDTMSEILYASAGFTDVINVQWSPSQNLFAFVGYNAYFDGGISTNVINNYGLYVSSMDVTIFAKIPIEMDTFARFHWLTGDEVVVTSCDDLNCISVIYDIETRSTTVRALGEFLLDEYITSMDRYLVSRIPDRNVFLSDGIGEPVQLSHVDKILSRPNVSLDERFLSFRARVSDRYLLQILDLETTQAQNIELSDEMPSLLAGNSRDSFTPKYNFYYERDDWQPEQNLLLYEDDNQVFLFDPMTGESKRVVAFNEKEELWTYQWVCD